MQNQFSVCVLLFGDNGHLARRCLSSIINTEGFGYYVRDVRIGLNSVSLSSRTYAQEWARRSADQFDVPVKFYEPVWGDAPALKYPVMRRMFYDTYDPADVLMWFDDDSYLAEQPQWWAKVARITSEHTIVGQLWKRDLEGNQWKWIREQPWASDRIMWHQAFRFPQGAWWCGHRSFIQAFNYPWPELRHCGGDAMLGELCLHQAIEPFNFHEGVHINADGLGRDSKSPRRGYTEELLARRYVAGTPLTTQHQSIQIRNWCIRRKNEHND